MPPMPSYAASARRYAAPAALGLVGLLTAVPGVHLFERWMASAPAVLVSHGLAAGLLGLALVRWRAARRAKTAGPDASDR